MISNADNLPYFPRTPAGEYCRLRILQGSPQVRGKPCRSITDSPACVIKAGSESTLIVHACAFRCRKCLWKWYRVPKEIELDARQQEKIVTLLLAWIEYQMRGTEGSKG